MKKIYLTMLVVVATSALAFAGGYQPLGGLSAVMSNNNDGTPGNPSILFKTARSGTTAITVAPYSALGTVGQVNLPNGGTAVNAIGQVVNFPLCRDVVTAAECTASLQKVRAPVVTNMSIPVAGLTTAVQTYGWNGFYLTSVGFGSTAVSSADSVLHVSIMQMPPQGHIIDNN